MRNRPGQTALALGLCLGNSLSGWGEEQRLPPRVFAHYVPWHPPSHARPDRTADTDAGVEGQVIHAIRSGIDGLAVDLVLSPPTRMVPALLNLSDIALRQRQDFAIIPCLDCAAIQSVDQWVDFLVAWLDAAGDRTSTFRVDGAAVVFTYGAYLLTPEQWRQIRQRLTAADQPLHLIGDMDALYRRSTTPITAMKPYLEVFDGLYFFAPNVPEHEQALLALLDEKPGATRLFSVMPGYWRVNTGSFTTPYRGTRTYRDMWSLAHRLGVDWVSITTWNDYSENTHIEPSRNGADAYARLTRLESFAFRGSDPPAATEAEALWLTAPAEMPDGPGPSPLESDSRRETLFEVLRLGPIGNGPLRVDVTLTDATGHPLLTRALALDTSTPVSDQQFSWEPSQALQQPYVWVQAETRDGRRARLPIPLWPRDIARRYTMAPRRARLSQTRPDVPRVDIAAGRLTVVPLPSPPGTRVDVLHDQWPQLDPDSTTAQVANGLDQLPNGPPGWGFWEAGCVTPDGRVAWSEPLFVPAPDGDRSVLALFRFNDVRTPSRDDSIYTRQHGRLLGRTAPLKDGTFALQSGVDSWFEPEGSFCPIDAPITVELWVFPEHLEGMLWGDVGAAMLLSLDAAGRPQFSRHTTAPEAWVGGNAEAPLGSGRWNHLAGVYTGQELVGYVNGHEVCRVRCNGPSGSASMGVGRNPYDQSNIFTGYIDDVRITARALLPPEFGPVNPLLSTPANPGPVDASAAPNP